MLLSVPGHHQPDDWWVVQRWPSLVPALSPVSSPGGSSAPQQSPTGRQSLGRSGIYIYTHTHTHTHIHTYMVDSWTTRVLNSAGPLIQRLFSLIILWYYTICGWLNPQIGKRRYRGTAYMEELSTQGTNYNLYLDFFYCMEGRCP